MATQTRLVEFVDARGAQIDAAAGLVRNVKVLGAESRNGRSYPPRTLAAAVSMYEGAACFLNHAESKGSRRYEDRFGTIHNVRMGDGDLFGDLKFNPKHPVAEQFAWDVEHSPGSCGLSHVIEAKVAKEAKTGRVVVEQILSVESVDLVAAPATTQGLFESLSDPKEKAMNLQEATVDTLRTERADLCEAIGKAAVERYLASEEAKTAAAEVQKLHEELDRYKTAAAVSAKQAAIDKLLGEAKLPAELISEVFRAQLDKAEDDAARKVLIEDRRKFSAGKPLSREQSAAGGSGGAGAMTQEQFLREIRGR